MDESKNNFQKINEWAKNNPKIFWPIGIFLIFLMVKFISGGSFGKPSACDCYLVERGAFGPDPNVREAAARIIGNDNAIDNPDRAARKCRLDYYDEFEKWKKSNDPNRSWSGDWQNFFQEMCK